MKAAVLFKQYVWLVDTIRRARRISLTDLSDRWTRTEFSEGTALSRTTFNRHRAAVEEIFGITIGCDADNKYYIVDSDLLRSNTVQEWMLSTLTVSNIVGEARGLHDRILLESIPTEGELLRQVVDAREFFDLYRGYDGWKKLMEQWLTMDLVDYYYNPEPFFEEVTLTTYMPADTYLCAVNRCIDTCYEIIPRRAEEIIKRLKDAVI